MNTQNNDGEPETVIQNKIALSIFAITTSVGYVGWMINWHTDDVVLGLVRSALMIVPAGTIIGFVIYILLLFLRYKNKSKYRIRFNPEMAFEFTQERIDSFYDFGVDIFFISIHTVVLQLPIYIFSSFGPVGVILSFIGSLLAIYVFYWLLGLLAGKKKK